MGRLSIVGTPIGNLGDITLRALEVLAHADVIACEDTRVTSKLLARHTISRPLMVFHARSGRLQTEKILTLLGEGKHVALVTDAGTPGVSDPGGELVSVVRERLQDTVTIETIPGPSALTAALSIAGVPVHEFVFLGFLPHKKGRETLFKEIGESTRTVVFYESPHRIMKTLESLRKAVKEGKVTILRELTKLHESYVSGTPEEVLEYFVTHKDEVRGEFVVIVSR